MLKDHKWDIRYTTDDGDLSEQFYVPVLQSAVMYDRGTGYFSADSLVRNIHGIKNLIDNKGKMRLLVGCTLDDAEVAAIQRGEDWKKQVEKNLSQIPLDSDKLFVQEGLELLSWMIAYGYLDIKISVVCDDNGTPVAGSSIYHKKIGNVRDTAGDRIAWSGSSNETPSGQIHNSESIYVYTSWEHPNFVERTEADFEADWAGRSRKTLVMDVPEAVRQKLLKYMPSKKRLPTILDKHDLNSASNQVWEFMSRAHNMPNGNMVGLTTAPVESWPHQVRVLQRLQSRKPARFLIADEVGLGKTIQAGLYLRQVWLEGRNKILVMAPASLVTQWQIELREKLNLDWPIYDGSTLTWQSTHARPAGREMRVTSLSDCGPVIMSSHLARRDEQMHNILDVNWDVVVLDEAHHARRKVSDTKKNTPGKLLSLMRELKTKTDDLILLTATPMQIHPVELYDLLDLLGMPSEWNWENFAAFTDCLASHNLASNMNFLNGMFDTSEKMYGPINESKLDSGMRGRKILRILRGEKERIQTGDCVTLERALRLCSPASQLMSRNTRKQLREYIKTNNLDWKLGKREIFDKFTDMSPSEQEIYDAVYAYTRKIWNSYKGTSRRATGFLSSTYLVRLTSSFAALRATLNEHLDYMQGKSGLNLSGIANEWGYIDDYDYDDDDVLDPAKNILKTMKRDTREVHRLLDMMDNISTDTKFGRLVKEIESLRKNNYHKIMVFTQFTDTMDFLRDKLSDRWSVMCYSGRGGEIIDTNGQWTKLTRDKTKKQFAQGSVDILLCTQAAAEGLNFQFCGALINYDMPWNPMKVEQRIGRIDRIGQEHNTICIVNMYYNGTIEAKRYRVLRNRYNMFEETVGTLPSILSGGDIFAKVADRDSDDDDESLPDLPQIDTSQSDLDMLLAADTEKYVPPESPITMEDISRVLSCEDIVRELNAVHAGRALYQVTIDNNKYRITADRMQFTRHSDSSEFWSPGTPLFPTSNSQYLSKYQTLRQLLDSLGVPQI